MIRHGTRSCYVSGCRRPECTRAAFAYDRELQRQRRRERHGIQPRQHRRFVAGPVEKHIAYLRAHGATMPAIARAARVALSTVKAIARGAYRWVRATTADRILAVSLSRVGVRVP